MKLTIATLLTLGMVLLPNEIEAPLRDMPYETSKPKVDIKIIKDSFQKEIDILKLKTGLNVVDYKIQEFELSFYTDLTCENSEYGNVNALGETLSNGMVANNYLPFGTQIYIPGYGLKEVRDRGSKKYFNNTYALDVFVPKKDGESTSDYYDRVQNMGRKTVTGILLEVEENK